MADRYICIHGHFYQPPRENPWLEAIELQDSAYPFHDWNDRITDECYAPNAAARILDAEHRIVRIVNNYARISFNFGPTLLSWLAAHAPAVYRAVQDADRESAARYSGHGSALAQVYNHMILPLANARDKQTQVVWGIRDFQHRFGRRPAGLWLAETAVDVETLEVLAAHDIQFTILAPAQARRVRPLAGGGWEETGAGIDPTMPYRADLPSGRSINLFFYDGPISQAVAFEGLLSNGERFARRLADGFVPGRNRPQLVHIATDGETYGHHHRHGEMALAYALDCIEAGGSARLTNYGEYLERHPPTHAVEIAERTAWSCAHGIERWRRHCGCQTGLHPGWNQTWRGPLREALDWLRDSLAPRFQAAAGEMLRDPWAARDAYIDVVLDRSPGSVQRFFAAHAVRPLAAAARVRALKLLEMQRHAMLMYTSCGWFFDEISGIETVQVLQYAARAIQLGEELFDTPLESRFLEFLERAPTNRPEFKSGAHVYERLAKPAMVGLQQVGAHYAVSSLFSGPGGSGGTGSTGGAGGMAEGGPERVYCYTVEREDYRRLQAGRAGLAVGRVRITSDITGESDRLSFGVLHFGDHNLNGGVRTCRGDDDYQALVREVSDAFNRADLLTVLRLLDRYFGGVTYSLKLLFRDEQRQILNVILDTTLREAAAIYSQVYENNAPLMRFLADLGTPLPKALHTAAEFVLNHRLRQACEDADPDVAAVRSILAEARSWQVELDAAGTGFALEQTIERLADALRREPGNLALLEQLAGLVDLAQSLPFDVDLWQVQNIYYGLVQDSYPQWRARAAGGEAGARAWVAQFTALGEKLRVRVDG